MRYTLRFLPLLFILICQVPVLAQGVIQGTIRDKKTGESIVGASVVIRGTTTGASTDIDGRYTIKNVKPGTYAVVISFISYKTDTLTGIHVTKDKPSLLDHQLTEVTTQLSEVSVTARRKTDTEISVIQSSKTSNLIIVGVSSQIIAKSSDKDASEVIRRLPGVSIMGGRFVVVRGLIERYNTVWLNNAATPSSETDQRAFSFDILPSQVIQNMVIYKTPAPEIPADFAGAFIEITTKNIPERNSIGLGYSVGYNEGTSFSRFEKYKGSGTDWLGFDNGMRRMPGSVPATPEMLSIQDYNNGTPEEQAAKKERMVGIARSFSQVSAPDKRTAPLDNRFTIDFTRILKAGETKIGITSALSYKTGYSADEILRSKVESYGATSTGLTYSKLYTDKKYDVSTIIGAISNFSLASGSTVIEFNNLFNQTGISSTVIRNGLDHYRDDNKVYKTLLGYSGRTIYSGSLAGTHPFSESHWFKWTVGYSYANQNEPDNRLINYYAVKKNDSVYYPYQLEYSATPNADANARLFSYVRENNYNANLNYKYILPFERFKPEIKAGVLAEYRTRDFSIRPFGIIWAKTGVINQEILHQPIDSVYARENFNFTDGVMYREIYDNGYQYKIENFLTAGYAALRIPIGRYFNLYGGVRLEKNETVLFGHDSKKEFARLTTRDTLNFFPSVNITFNINEKNLIRFAYGRTVNRPEFREISPFSFYNFRENVTVYGNPQIKSAYVNNFDFRYEWYPSPGEMVTIGAFYKTFDSPIEATWVPASGGEWDLHYLNAKKATSLGAEADIRIGLGRRGSKTGLSGILNRFSVVFNAAYIRSRVETNPEYLFVLDRNRPMYGQSPYILNAGLFYQTEKNDLSVNLLYNVFGKRIIGIGTPDIPNSYEMPRHVIDLTIMKKSGKNLSVKLGVKDLLNQESVIRQTMKTEGLPDAIIKVKAFRPGRSLSLGISYTL